MQIQISTGHTIDGRDALSAWIRGVVGKALDRSSDHITRVEVHLRDENSGKGGQDDKHCMMEARIEGRQPMAVTHQAAAIEQAVMGAADKLARMVESAVGRSRDQSARRTDPAPPGSTPDTRS